jgi:outer membrane receptor for ferrienterochelin and colicins
MGFLGFRWLGWTVLALLAVQRLTAADASSLLDLSLDDLSQVEIKTDIESIREKSIDEQPGIVSVISESEIKDAGARDLSEVLMQVPGFALDTDVESMVGLTFRGLQGQEGKVLLLVDGMEVNDPLYGSLPILNHIPADLIRQVEIIRGPGGAQYGGDSGLAVIKVSVLDASQDGGFAVFTPSYAAGRISESFAASLGFTLTDWRVSASFSTESTTLSNRTYASIGNPPLNLTNADSMHPVFFDFGVGWRDLDIKVIYDRYRYDDSIDYGETVPSPNYTHFDSLLGIATYTLKVSDRLRILPKLSYRNQVPWYVSGPLGEYEAGVTRYEAELTAVDDVTEMSSVLLGVQWRRDRADVHGSSYYNEVPADFFSNDSPTVAYNDKAVFAQYDWDAPWLSLSLGGRYERQDYVGGHFVPRFAVTKVLGPWHVKALASQASRIPAINVIAESVGPRLQPEETTNYEIEAGYKFSGTMSLTGNVFYMGVDRPIIYETFKDDGDGYYNGKRISSAGIESEFRWSPTGFTNYAGFSLYRAVDNSEPYVRADSTHFVGSPSYKFSFGSTWHASRNLSLNVNGYWLSQELAYTAPSGNLTGLPAVVVTNTFVDYSFKHAFVGLGVSNLFNQTPYAPQPYNGGEAPIPLMGRTVFFKLGWKF